MLSSYQRHLITSGYWSWVLNSIRRQKAILFIRPIFVPLVPESTILFLLSACARTASCLIQCHLPRVPRDTCKILPYVLLFGRANPTQVTSSRLPLHLPPPTGGNPDCVIAGQRYHAASIELEYHVMKYVFHLRVYVNYWGLAPTLLARPRSSHWTAWPSYWSSPRWKP